MVHIRYSLFLYQHHPLRRQTFQSVAEMDVEIIKNWNAYDDPNDTVFFLGDFGLGTTDFLANLCARLHGHKVCICGNHDVTPAKMHKIVICDALDIIPLKF
jgi:calcineurin-like phosphoesterase family protein